MIELIFAILSSMVFNVLWKFMAQCPALIARVYNLIKKQNAPQNLLLVFSATTANNAEVEFIDESLLEDRKLIRALRILLLGSYAVFAFYLLNK